MAVPPELLGFARTKVGANETEPGYQISKTRLTLLIGGAGGSVLFLAALLVLAVYEVHFTKRSHLTTMALKERKASHVLVRTELMLWEQYLAAKHESFEAHTVLEELRGKYVEFQETLREEIRQASRALDINRDKGDMLAERILDTTGKHKAQSMDLMQRLVDVLLNDARETAKHEARLLPHLLEDIGSAAEEDREDGTSGGFGSMFDKMVKAMFDHYDKKKAAIAFVKTISEADVQFLEATLRDMESEDAALAAAAVRRLREHHLGVDFLEQGFMELGREDHFVRVALAERNFDVGAFEKLREDFESGSKYSSEVLQVVRGELSDRGKFPEHWFEVMVNAAQEEE